MISPFVTVLTTAYNAYSTISRAIVSILNQTYTNFEYIIINDGSTDNTLNIIQSFNDSRLRIINQKNIGKVRSLNKGIQLAEGTYIAMLDADDESHITRLQKQIDFIKDSKYKLEVVGTATEEIYSDGTCKIRYRPSNNYEMIKNIVKICPITHSSALINKNVFNIVGLYNIYKDGPMKKSIGEDYDIWVRMLSHGIQMANMNDVLTRYYRSPLSSIGSRTLIQKVIHRLRARNEAIQQLKLPKYYYIYFIPVFILTIFEIFNIKYDKLFNFISSRSERK
jgi:glycosyltransferase involved in cell wall biosynthesis